MMNMDIWLNSRVEGEYSTSIVYDNKGLTISKGKSQNQFPIFIVFDEFFQWTVFCDSEIYHQIDTLLNKFLASNKAALYEVEFVAKVTDIVRAAVLRNFAYDPDAFTQYMEGVREHYTRAGRDEEKSEVASFLRRYLP